MDWFLIAGLGNPEKKYYQTRHNFGWRVVDHLVDRLDLTQPETTVSYRLWIKSPLLLLQPLTFMNRSGEAVSEVARFFKIEFSNLLIVHDDLDLDLGVMRIKEDGGAAGHHGIESIQESLGTDHFTRLRLGIGRPEKGLSAEDYVLQPFASDEADLVKRIIDEAGKIVLELSENHRLPDRQTIRVES